MSPLASWLVPRMAAPAVVAPFPGWYLGAGERGLAGSLRRKIWRRLRQSLVVPWIRSLRIEILPANETSRSIFITGRYEPNEFSLLARVLKPGMTFVDVGANQGLYALFAATLVGEAGRVIAIEASSREFAQLERNLALNPVPAIRPIRAAVSDRRCELALRVAPAERSGHNTLGAFAYESTRLERYEPVLADRLDHLLGSEARVDVIKMDIEGAEFAALRGAGELLRRFHPLLLIEIADPALRHQQASSREVLDWLAGLGYGIYDFDPATGLPRPAERKSYYDSENIIAVLGKPPW